MHSPKTVTIAPPAPAPPPPSIDIAMQSQQQNQLLRQRQGAASTVLAGQNPASPTTGGMAALLGG